MSDLDAEELQAGLASPLEFAITNRDRKVMEMVDHAIANGNVMLAYQPVVQTSAPDHVAFHEGLIRVMDDTGRIIPARQFIEVAETRETGRRLDCLALQEGLGALALFPGLRLSVNMSARSIGYSPWIDVLESGIAAAPTIAERLILEITESSAMIMPDVVAAFMKRLQSKGICFALDDFGAGYTSFRYLRDLMFDVIKIDGQFIRGIHADPDNQVLAQALVDISRHFDMLTVAEAVESAADMAWLQAIGVDCMQGYYFGAPTTRPAWMTGQQKLLA